MVGIIQGRRELPADSIQIRFDVREGRTRFAVIRFVGTGKYHFANHSTRLQLTPKFQCFLENLTVFRRLLALLGRGAFVTDALHGA